jgi:hypothetical protein
MGLMSNPMSFSGTLVKLAARRLDSTLWKATLTLKILPIDFPIAEFTVEFLRRVPLVKVCKLLAAREVSMLLLAIRSLRLVYLHSKDR